MSHELADSHATGLWRLAELIGSHPEATAIFTNGEIRILAYTASDEELGWLLHRMDDGGVSVSVDRSIDTSFLEVLLHFSPSVTVRVMCPRSALFDGAERRYRLPGETSDLPVIPDSGWQEAAA